MTSRSRARRSVFYEMAGLLVFAAPILYGMIGPLHLFGTLSVFPYGLPDTPLFWWPLTCWPILIVFGVWGLTGLWITDKTPLSGPWLLGITGTLCLSALIADMGGGVALYADRIVVRDLNRFSVAQETLWLKDVRSVSLLCDKTTRYVRRGGSKRLPDAAEYRVSFANGRVVNLTEGDYKTRVQARWLKAMTTVDARLSANGVPRRLSPDQDPAIYGQCLNLFTDDFAPQDRAAYTYLFSPDAPK
ncbi:hypothetical protein PQU92_09450 [Asticcacaulis sp. BYS171W]|uniref:Uncharacterized protein n=1 Tax=Asticcacaulis aquaticus TaxID=2984212 RepID=A0ABT5HTV4_9CAUL|nr:hypothetical protein [Asticcacaulis aquaticus]MDC7683500.1 hypothetical protein [Asticcacaulis aquaticus]